MKSILKAIALLLFLMIITDASVSKAAEPTLNQQRESILYATLTAMGFEKSTAIVTDNEVVVDYIIKPLQSDVDLVLQLQSIFIASAKIAPNCVLTVIKGRYDSKHPPMVVVAVPTNVTQKLVAEVIEPATFWQLVTVNDEALLDATERQERKGLSPSPRAQQYASLIWKQTSFDVSRGEMIRNLALITGLGDETIKQLVDKQPALFDPLEETLLAVKVVDLLYQARSAEELAERLPWQSSKVMNHLVETVYPPAMQPWVNTLTRYKVSLGLLPEGVALSQIDPSVANEYEQERGGFQDHRIATPRQAYQKLLSRGLISTARQMLHDDFVQARGAGSDPQDDQMDKYLWAKADTFLRNRLEAGYQRGLFRKSHQTLTDYLWSKKQVDLENVRKSAVAVMN